MDLLNQKLDRAVEAAKIKPAAKLREMQNNEKLVAVNERIEEAMNYRKELKEFEVKEAERVHMLKEKNAENQRKALLAGQVSLNCTDPFAEKGDGPTGEQDRNQSPQLQDLNGQRSKRSAEANQFARARY